MTFNEQLIKAKRTAKQWALLIFIWFFAFALSVLLLWIALGLSAQSSGFFLIAVMGVLGLGYGAFWVTGLLSLEYEYAVFEGELSIDKISGKRKRKRVVQVSPRKIEKLAPAAALNASEHFDRIVIASPSKAEATWFVTYRSKKNGHTLVLFSPCEDLLRELYKDQTRSVQVDCDNLCSQYNVTFEK